jgi:hypothetical protein
MTRTHVLRFILVTALMAVAGRAEAQEFGVKGGVQFTDIAWGDEILLETPWGWGLTGGMFLRFWPAKALSLQTEALVTQLVIDFSSEGSDAKNTLTNLQVPVLLRYTVVSGESLRVRALGGGAMDFVLFARESVGDESLDIRQTVAPWSASLVAAGEVEWRRWVFDVRYLFGLTDIYHPDVAVAIPAKQRSLQVTAGWRF